MSAYSQLFGIYQQDGGDFSDNYPIELTLPPSSLAQIDQINSSLTGMLAYLPNNVQPVPVHVVEESDDTLLINSPSTCPEAQTWENQRESDSNTQAVYQSLNSTIEYLNNNDCTINGIWDLWLLGDTLTSDYYANFTMPCGLNYTNPHYNSIVFAYEWFTNYMFVGTGQMLQLYSFNLL